MIVQKYGGSSVGTPEKIKKVAARIAEARQKGEQVVVVVSAMGDTTDELIELAHAVTENPHERELDMLLSVGERISMALLSMALRDLRQEAISFTGSQAGIITDESHTRARIVEIRPIRVLDELSRGKVVIVAGFQGVSRSKEITTLGRGGSDTTAVSLAVALHASHCEIFTDVPGVFSADPRMVPSAIRYEKLPLDLVHEMALKGAQVMHARSIEVAMEERFPLYVGLAHPPANEQVGTMLLPDGSALMAGLPRVVAVTLKRDLTAFRFEERQMSELSPILEKSGIQPHTIVREGGGALIFIDSVEAQSFLLQYRSHVVLEKMDAISVVGYRMADDASVQNALKRALEGHGIRPAGLTCHPQSITVWFPAMASESNGISGAVRAVHDALVTRN